MYLECIRWRKERSLDFLQLPPDGELVMPVRGYSCISDSNPPIDSKWHREFYVYTGGGCFHKWDKEGLPIYIERMGYHDTQALVKIVSLETVLEAHVRNNEFLTRVLMKECSDREQRPIGTAVIIADLQGLGLHMFNVAAINILRSLQEIDQKYYPERLGRVFIINAPKVFTLFWNVIKKWLDDRIKSKIHIVGHHSAKMLLQYIDAENLPTFLGGTCRCEGTDGGCVPAPRLIEGVNIEFEFEISVSARSRYYHKLELTEQRATVECTFKSQKHPISCFVMQILHEGELRSSFSSTTAITAANLSRGSIDEQRSEASHDAQPKSKKDNELIVRPSEHFDSHKETASFCFRTLHPGTYAIVFDNKASLLTAKKVSYSVRIQRHSIGEDPGDVSQSLSRVSLPLNLPRGHEQVGQSSPKESTPSPTNPND